MKEKLKSIEDLLSGNQNNEDSENNQEEINGDENDSSLEELHSQQ